MMAMRDGFVKILLAATPAPSLVAWWLVSAFLSRFYPIALAVEKKLAVDDLADTFTVTPRSLALLLRRHASCTLAACSPHIDTLGL